MISVQLRPNPVQKSGNRIEATPFIVSGVVNWQLTMHPTYWRPPTDVYETEDRYVIQVEIAGMRDGEFSVSIENNIISIRGVRQDVLDRRAFHQMEIRYGDFGTDIELPNLVDINLITAEYQDGFLWVNLPKAHPTKIKVGD
ncbi:MAG: Hsp20/alpha crystallin family protein [Chloroflexi bacterium]|nr:Hsp20/alpha crystallin family protein [Chloroflexota bacterium]